MYYYVMLLYECMHVFQHLCVCGYGMLVICVFVYVMLWYVVVCHGMHGFVFVYNLYILSFACVVADILIYMWVYVCMLGPC